MPARVLVFVHERPELTIEAVTAGIAPADWKTLAEDFDTAPDDVDRFLDAMRWEDRGDHLNLVVDGDANRPLQVRWSTDDVSGEVAELDDWNNLVIPDRVRAHLADVTAIVDVEFGVSQYETMFEVVAFEIAYWAAEVGRGVILAPNNRWHDHDANRWDPIN